ncbi:PLP-dependent aminotransferase family protein [Cohaesibacter sp. CAU 1516]|uniref:MocR-like ectoine utilization transcription factor EhuR n=1 Tax=Cohaesibacter sp. CAU 1516 TaxID=2576038 RepID=UPI0014856B95|nr:PLP-dependent aminotransferase family protein [Cohaesibacter sp. CAU 1516]
MTNWMPDPDHLQRPVYKTLQSLIIDAIDSGDLRAGERMPTHREFAYQLKISVQTVSRTYDALCKLGYLVGEVGRGTYVRYREGSNASMPFLPNRQEGLVDLSMLKPVTSALHYDTMQKGLKELSRGFTRDLVHSFRPDEAFRDHLALACRWLKSHHIHADPYTAIFTNGAIPALTASIMSAAPPGSTICAEDVSFHSIRPLCEYLGICLQTIGMDEQGIRPDAFEAACQNTSLRALIISPTVANPRAYVMGSTRRQEIIDIARRHDVFIIENDVLGTLIKGAPATMHQLDPERVFYITSFSKTIMPGMRIGLLVTPPSMYVATKNRHLVTNWMANPLMVDLLTHWFENGTADHLIDWQARALHRRQKLADKLLAGHSFSSHKYAPHIWLPLPKIWNEQEFLDRARKKNVALAGSLPFIMSEHSNEGDLETLNAVRIALGPCDEDLLAYALKVVATLLASDDEKPLPMF